jgi:PPOX class probable F420-dependent enzyme
VAQLRDAKYLLLESERAKTRPGLARRCRSPSFDDTAFLRTKARAAKVRRIRRRPFVKVATCTIRGKPLNDYIECAARIVPQEREAQAEAAPRRVYGPLRRLLNTFVRNDHVYLELTPIDPPERSLREDEALPSGDQSCRWGPGDNPTLRRPMPHESRSGGCGSGHDERAVSRGAAFDPRI